MFDFVLVFDTIEQVMASPEQYEKSFYDYVVQKGFSNSLFIGTKKSSAAAARLSDQRGEVPDARTRGETRASGGSGATSAGCGGTSGRN